MDLEVGGKSESQGGWRKKPEGNHVRLEIKKHKGERKGVSKRRNRVIGLRDAEQERIERGPNG